MRIEKDKRDHALVGAGISLAVGLLVTPWLGLILAGLAGAGKEVYDYIWSYRGHTPEFLDFVYTLGGGLVPFTLLIAFG